MALMLLIVSPVILNALLIILFAWALVRACRSARERLYASAIALAAGAACFILYYAAHSGDWIYAEIRYYTFTFGVPVWFLYGLAGVLFLALQRNESMPRHVKVPVLVGLLFAPFVAFMFSVLLDDRIRAAFSVSSHRWL